MQVLRKTRTITNQNQAEVLQIRRIKNLNLFSFFQNSGLEPSLDEAASPKKGKLEILIMYLGSKFPPINWVKSPFLLGQQFPLLIGSKFPFLLGQFFHHFIGMNSPFSWVNFSPYVKSNVSPYSWVKLSPSLLGQKFSLFLPVKCPPFIE